MSTLSVSFASYTGVMACAVIQAQIQKVLSWRGGGGGPKIKI